MNEGGPTLPALPAGRSPKGEDWSDPEFTEGESKGTNCLPTIARNEVESDGGS